jgi:ATP-binding protein involved in chromosome partitioning
MANAEEVRVAVGTVVDPELRKTILELGMLESVSLESGEAKIRVLLTIEGCPKRSHIETEVRNKALSVAGVEKVDVVLGVMTKEQREELTESVSSGRTPQDRFGPNSLTRVIAVASGKGGVGKSTVSVNLAAALAAQGLSVGILDLDVHGFSIPALFGIEGEKPTKVGDLILPPVAQGIPIISIGMFVEPNTPVSWRGPMLHRTVNQFLSDVYFGDIDYLICDLPPGTGDVAMSLGQLLPNAEVIVVTTPQKQASEVAVRSGLLAEQLGQKVIGVVETMTDWVDDSGTRHSLFGNGGGADVSERLGCELLGSVPLSADVNTAGENGIPITLSNPNEPVSLVFKEIAKKIEASRKPRKALPIRL